LGQNFNTNIPATSQQVPQSVSTNQLDSLAQKYTTV